MRLRPYQYELDQGIHAAWSSGYRNVLAVSPTGSGKTVLFSETLRKHQGASVAIAHRQELVSQMSLALARNEVMHRVVGPNEVVREICQIHQEELGRVYYNANAPCAVAGVDTIMSWSKPESRHYQGFMRWAQQVTKWVCDECFPAGTLVDGKPIESLQPGDTVTAFDERTGKFAKKEIVRLFRNPMPQFLVRVKVDKRVVDCTANHPFWTKRGWVNAIDLSLNDEVLIYDNVQLVRKGNKRNRRNAAVSFEKNRSDILSEVVRVQSSRRESYAETGENITGSSLYDLPKTCGSERSSVTEIPRYRKGVLQQNMLNSVPGKTIIGNNGSHESQVCVGQDEIEQPHVETRCKKENDGNPQIDGAQTAGARRQREASCSCGVDTGHLVRAPRVHDADQYPNRYAEGVRLSSSVQSGPRPPCIEDCDRSGWEQPRYPVSPATGPQEGRVACWARVDSITLQKRRDTGKSRKSDRDCYVYNIEVADFHTYVANSIVVHNCHHLCVDNKWGTAVNLFPNAVGLGVTATPERADGKGLGRHADGLFDVMIQGPTMRDLINGLPDWNGGTTQYLTDYRIICPPPTNFDLSQVGVGKDGDYVTKKLGMVTRDSSIMGDVVEHYLRFASGRLGVTFAPDVETATELSKRFNEAGVPAEVVSAKTPGKIRRHILRQFRQRKVMQLVNVDLFGEGFDLPAIECVSMARATQSYGLYVQQFGRALRLMDGKDRAIIIDHVGNVIRHGGPPDRPRVWTLDRRDKRCASKDDGTIPMRNCLNPECMAPFERIYPCCPMCGWVPVPAGRTAPEMVDGDLMELDEATLRALRGEVERIDRSPEDVFNEFHPLHGYPIAKHQANKHAEKQQAQAALRDAIAWFGGVRRHAGIPDAVSYREFYFKFGIDVVSAQSLARADAEILTQRINASLGRAA